MELGVFDQVADAVRGMLPDDVGEPSLRAHRYGIKVWFGPATPTREHYEAQVVGAKYVDDAEVLAIEVGFHAENKVPDDNDDVLARLVKRERTWRRALGDDAVAGPFLGRPDDWRRLSETWPDPDLGDPALPMELASRLVDYITVLEPLRTAGSAAR
jgi:hypothetical protein